MKPSKTIKKKAYETIYSEEHDIPSDIFLPEEAFLAICDYLDEEYEKKNMRNNKRLSMETIK